MTPPVNVNLLDVVTFAVELALNCAPVIGVVCKLGDEIDTRVALVEAAFLGPVGEHQHAAKLRLLGPRILKPYFHVALELGAFSRSDVEPARYFSSKLPNVN